MSSRSSFSERCEPLLDSKVKHLSPSRENIETYQHIDPLVVTSPPGGPAVGGSVLQEPQAVLPVHCHPSNKQRWTRLQQGEGDGDQVGPWTVFSMKLLRIAAHYLFFPLKLMAAVKLFAGCLAL